MKSEGEILTSEQGEVIEKGKIDFDALLKEREQLTKQDHLRYATISRLLLRGNESSDYPGLLDDSSVREGWEKTIAEINLRTNTIGELTELGIFDGSANEMQVDYGRFLIDVKFINHHKPWSGSSLKDKLENLTSSILLSGRGKAAFVATPKKSEILFKGQRPSSREMWYDMATLGYFANEAERIGLLSHELIHALNYQALSAEEKKKIFDQNIIKSLLFLAGGFPGFIYSKILKRERTSRDVLDETAAMMSSREASLINDSSVELINHFKKNYGFENIDMLIVALAEVEKLRILGLDANEMADLVNSAKWDKETTSFPLLEDKIKRLTREKKLNPEEVDNLVLAGRLKRDIERQKARLIAQEELKKLAEAKGIKI